MSKLRHVITMLSLGGYTSQDAYNMVQILKEVEAENTRFREALESIEEQAESGYKESHWIAVAKTAQDALERK